MTDSPDNGTPGDLREGGNSPSLGALILAVLWLCLTAAAFAKIASYSHSPAPRAVPPSRWPAQSSITLDATRPNLVMFAHPRCPCTRASIGELALLMAGSQGLVNAHVLFVKPKGMNDEWVMSDIWKKASAIPGVVVQADAEGIETSRFHSQTSGEVLVYGGDGRLMFQGGITVSRGHSGDNEGRSSIQSLLRKQTPAETMTPVFGCSLFGPDDLQKGTACRKN